MKTVYDLYLDESGDFIEYNPDNKCRQFHSQIAGLVAPKDEFTKKAALKILRECYKSIGITMTGDEVHGNAFRPGKDFDKTIETLVKEIGQRKGWQAVRLVNKEEIYLGGFNDYVSMIGELALRIFIEKSKKHSGDIVLNFYCAERSVEEAEELYEQTIRNYIAFAAVRRGVSAKSSRWRIGNLEILRAKNSRKLQVCDLLNNSSYDNYSKCGDKTASRLEKAFSNYNYTMALYREIEQCDRFIDSGSLGLAIRVLAERLNQPDKGGNVRSGAVSRLDSILDNLARQTATDRNIQLSMLTNWLAQLIEEQRSLELGYKLAQWFYIEIHQPLATRLEDRTTLDWFEYALHFWLLTAGNHQGNLIYSRQAANKLVKLTPVMAQQWEHINLLMEGLVADAVHRTDCWEYDTVAVQMKLVADYFAEVSSLFTVALPEIFPDRVRSQLRGKALGTWLQSEIYASAAQPQRLYKARGLSALCIEEFTSPGDKAIQYQYRCQLETIAQDFPTAREYLARSLDLEDNSHQAIALQINNLTQFACGFALLHWLRLGAIAHLSDNHREWNEFTTALKQSKLLNNSWCTGQESTNYPAHGILRRVSLIQFISGGTDLTALNRLRNLEPIKKGNFVLAIIQCAASAEAAAFLWDRNNSLARKTLNGDKHLGLQQLLETLADKSNSMFPQVNELTQSWLRVVGEVLANGENAKGKLLELGRQVGY